MEAITTKKLKELKADFTDLKILDVLGADHYESGHLPDADNIPVDDENFVDEVRDAVDSESTPIVVYCANEDCPASDTAAERLDAAGFEKVYDLTGGIKEWKDAGEDVESAESTNDASDTDTDSDTKQSESKSTPAGGATVEWHKTLKDGTGRMMLDSAEGIEIPYSYATRFGEEHGTNPEEMLSAALAGCFSMALSGALGKAGYTPELIETTAEVSMSKSDDGPAINGISLRTEAEITEIEDDTFQEIANDAKENCPVSTALDIPIELEATLAGSNN